LYLFCLEKNETKKDTASHERSELAKQSGLGNPANNNFSELTKLNFIIP